MKQIFDLLREQIKESMVELIPLAVPRTERSYGKELAFTRSLAIINEAEAKWEADCCEWKSSMGGMGIFAFKILSLYSLAIVPPVEICHGCFL